MHQMFYLVLSFGVGLYGRGKYVFSLLRISG